VMNAANEAAVDLFRSGAIGFADITAAVEDVLQRHEACPNPNLDELMSADAWARREVRRCVTC